MMKNYKAFKIGDRVMLTRYYCGYAAGSIFIVVGEKQPRKGHKVPVIDPDHYGGNEIFDLNNLPKEDLKIPNKYLERI